jgi:hypothetical protein
VVGQKKQSMIRALWLVILMVCLVPVYAQIEELEDRLAGVDLENLTQAEGVEGYQIRLEQYRKHPLNLNRATAEELSELGLLTAMQIESWIRYRARIGMADQWYVLQGVPGWDWQTVEQIRPYVQLIRQVDWKGFLQNNEPGKHTLLIRWSTSSATQLPERTIGDASQQLVRYQYQSAGGIEAGLMMEKDPGESWRRPDFFSGYIRIQVPGRANYWTIGDYTVQMGQGLIAWQGMSVASGSDLTSLKKQGRMIRAYQSVGESQFMRGVGYSGSKQRWVWDAFVSRQAQTAVLHTVRNNELFFRSVDESGYHRTEAERLRKDGVTEYTAGGRLGIRTNSDRLNFNFIARSWSHSQMKLHEPVYADTIYLRSLINVSADYSVTRGNWHGFGEWAVDVYGNRALVFGSMLVLHRSVEAGVQVRWIGRHYQTVSGEVLQQRSGVGAEQGIRLQARWQLTSRVSIDLYGDLYRIPTPHFLTETPSVGAQSGIRLHYQPSKQRSIYLRVVTNDSEEMGAGNWLSPLVNVRQSSIRLHTQWDINTRFQMAVRAEKKRRAVGHEPPETGFLNYAELRYDPIGTRLKADLRLMWVQTDGWGSRIYAYERNVLHQVGFPAFSGSLIRTYLNLAWQWSQNRTVWFRWAVQKNIDNQSLNKDFSPIVQSFTLQFRLELGSGGR